MTNPLSTMALAAAVLTVAFVWLTARTVRLPTTSHERLIAELRMTQLGSLVLVLVAGAYVGFAAWQDTRLGVGLDVALALGFLAIAFTTLTRDPRQGLILLAVAFATHALLDVVHRPGWLPAGMAPRWYAVGCAWFNVALGACCYLPVLRR